MEDPFSGWRMGSCLILRNELSEETHVLTKKETVGKWCLGEEQQGKETQENCSATWLTVSGFMGMGFISGFSLASHRSPSQILPVSLQGSTMFLIRASCCGKTHARGCCHAWLRWAALVNGAQRLPLPSLV